MPVSVERPLPEADLERGAAVAGTEEAAASAVSSSPGAPP
jgi:hypothetical protein